MEPNAVERTITDHIVEEYLYDRPDVVLDSDFPLVQEGVVDSLGIFRLVGFLEKTFAVKIGKDDVVLENFVNVAAMKQLVLGKLAAGAAGGGAAGDA